MVTKSGILGLIIGVATVLIIASAVGENANSQVSEIGIVEESGFSQDCAVPMGGNGCYAPSVLTIKSGTVVTMTNTDQQEFTHLHQELLMDKLLSLMEYLIQIF